MLKRWLKESEGGVFKAVVNFFLLNKIKCWAHVLQYVQWITVNSWKWPCWPLLPLDNHAIPIYSCTFVLVTWPLPPSPPPLPKIELDNYSKNYQKNSLRNWDWTHLGARDKTWPLAISGHPSSSANPRTLYSIALEQKEQWLWRSNVYPLCTCVFT